MGADIQGQIKIFWINLHRVGMIDMRETRRDVRWFLVEFMTEKAQTQP